MSDQQAQELTPAEREIVRGLKAWEFGCSDEESEGFYAGAKAALLAARPVQVERPDEPTNAEIQAVAIALWEAGNKRLGVERDREVIGEYVAEAEAALLAAAAARLPVRPDEEAGDDARHITWAGGHRTLCGKHMPNPERDVNGYYLPLGRAPRTDEGGAWCWPRLGT